MNSPVHVTVSPTYHLLYLLYIYIFKTTDNIISLMVITLTFMHLSQTITSKWFRSLALTQFPLFDVYQYKPSLTLRWCYYLPSTKWDFWKPLRILNLSMHCAIDQLELFTEVNRVPVSVTHFPQHGPPFKHQRPFCYHCSTSIPAWKSNNIH